MERLVYRSLGKNWTWLGMEWKIFNSRWLVDIMKRKTTFKILATIIVLIVAVTILGLRGSYIPFVAYASSRSAYASCSQPDVENNKISCTLYYDDFYTSGMSALDGIGIKRVSEAWTPTSLCPEGGMYFGSQIGCKRIKTPNRCSGQITLSGAVCNMGNCHEGCGLDGSCPIGTPPAVTFTFTGTPKGDACIYDEPIKYDNPCCFGEFGGKPPGVSGNVVFYYEEEAVECIPEWTCGDWEACTPSGTQKRVCHDGCGEIKEETQQCEYIETGSTEEEYQEIIDQVEQEQQEEIGYQQEENIRPDMIDIAGIILTMIILGIIWII